VQVAKALVAAGADVDLPDKSTAMTPLHYGAMGGHLDIIDSLIGAMCLYCLTLLLCRCTLQMY
jgi:ankyrin repeat protein